jgi:hypothetical protein
MSTADKIRKLLVEVFPVGCRKFAFLQYQAGSLGCSIDLHSSHFLSMSDPKRVHQAADLAAVPRAVAGQGFFCNIMEHSMFLFEI